MPNAFHGLIFAEEHQADAWVCTFHERRTVWGTFAIPLVVAAFQIALVAMAGPCRGGGLGVTVAMFAFIGPPGLLLALLTWGNVEETRATTTITVSREAMTVRTPCRTFVAPTRSACTLEDHWAIRVRFEDEGHPKLEWIGTRHGPFLLARLEQALEWARTPLGYR